MVHVWASDRRWLGAVFLIAVLVVLAWWVGVHTDDPPAHPHSLGIAARVCVGPKRSERCGGELTISENIGRNLPSQVRCSRCFNGTDLMRYEPEAGLRVDMVVKVHPRVRFPYITTQCGQATVDMVISGTKAFWAQHNRLVPVIRRQRGRKGTGKPIPVTTEIALGWDPFTHLTRPAVRGIGTQPGSPALVAVMTSDQQAPLHPALYTDGDLLGADIPSVLPYPATRPRGLRIRLSNWGYRKTLEESPIHLHFVANWLARRGWGSCYVVLPSLLANGAFAATQNALAALVQGPVGNDVPLEAEAQPPSYGRVALAATGSLSLGDTSPPPSDYEAIAVDTHGTLPQRVNEFVTAGTGDLGPVWTCTPSDNLTYLSATSSQDIPATGSFAGNACGVVAVVNTPAANDIRATVLILLGVLIAIAFEYFFRVRPRLRRETDEPAGVATEPDTPDREGGDI